MKSRAVRLGLYAIAIAIIIFGIMHGWLNFQDGNWFPLGGSY